MKQQRMTFLLAAASCLICTVLIGLIFTAGSSNGTASGYDYPDIKAAFGENIQQQLDIIMGKELAQKPILTLQDHDLVAPMPNAECYGAVNHPEEMLPVLEEAQLLLQDQPTLFTAETPVMENTPIRYYLDDSIFAVTWKQVIDDGVYTFSEVKLAHASQFRRFLSGGQYGSKVLHTTTEMAESVNAVVASSGDYYGYRSFGIVVHNGQAYRGRGELLDTCYIDENGDLLFTYAEELVGKEAVQKFADENKVRFSLCFGPVLVLNGECCVPARYNSGEINKAYARAALCQMGPLHYVVVTANQEKGHYKVPTVKQFGQRLQEMGIPTAYALDGGQTASIVMNNELINQVSYGSQRKISDIIYFATAVPDQASQGGT